MNLKARLLLILLFFGTLKGFCSGNSAELDSLWKCLNQTKVDSIRINCLDNIAYDNLGSNNEKAIEYATQALQLAIDRGYATGRIKAYNVLGLAFYYLNEYDQALVWHQRSTELSSKVGDFRQKAVALNNIGLVYDDRGDYEKALYYYLESMKLSDKDEKNKMLYASSMNNVALIYQSQKDFDKALEFHTKALELKKSLGNKRGVGNSLHNLGLVYKLKGDYEKSLQYYFEALPIRQEVGDLIGEGITYNNIGSVYDSKGEHEKAFPFYEKALSVLKETKDKYNTAITLFSLGSNYCDRKQMEKGLVYLNEAMGIARSLGARDLEKFGYEVMTAYYSEKGDYKQAFDFQSRYIQLKDSLFNLENSKQLNALQNKYEDEKKQKEIDLLTKDSEIQALQLNRNKLWFSVLSFAIVLVLLLAALLFNRYKLKQAANNKLEQQNSEISQQKKEITDSINYAKRIQESILPPAEHWQRLLPSSFIFYRPKDIVSGDFYWIEGNEEQVFFAAVDCTGHGVPGALMSVVGFNLLTQAVNEVALDVPAEILKHLDAGVTKTLRQSGEGVGVKDGMDLSLCVLNKKTKILQYAGAFNSLYYVRNKQFFEVKADKFPIGINLDGIVDDYNNHSMQMQTGDMVYLFSDGYADQFGGPNGKKFKYKLLKELLVEVSDLPISEQELRIAATFDQWKGELEQVDDVLIIGVQI